MGYDLALDRKELSQFLIQKHSHCQKSSNTMCGHLVTLAAWLYSDSPSQLWLLFLFVCFPVYVSSTRVSPHSEDAWYSIGSPKHPYILDEEFRTARASFSGQLHICCDKNKAAENTAAYWLSGSGSLRAWFLPSGKTMRNL